MPSCVLSVASFGKHASNKQGCRAFGTPNFFGVAGMNISPPVPSTAFTPGDPVALLENEHYDHGGKDHFPLINKLVGLLKSSKDKIRTPLALINVDLLNNICEAIILALAEQESFYGATNRRALTFEEYKTLNICMKELIDIMSKVDMMSVAKYIFVISSTVYCTKTFNFRRRQAIS